MNNDKWFVLTEVDGSYKAEILKGFLEAQGISVILSQEGAGSGPFALTVGELGRVQVFVPVEKRSEAEELLAELDSGEFSEGEGDSAE